MRNIEKLIVASIMVFIGSLLPVHSQVEFIEMFVRNHDGIDGLEQMNDIDISQDDEYVYVTGGNSSILIFSRDKSSGDLSFVKSVVNSRNNIRSIQGIEDIIVTDTHFVYSAGYHSIQSEATLSAFNRSETSGNLSLIDTYINGEGSVQNLNRYSKLVVTNDKKFMYSLSEADEAIVCFSRQSDGSLAYVNSYVNGTGGISRMNAPTDLAVSFDDKHIYVTSDQDSAIHRFSRDPVTGALTIEATTDFIMSINGANSPSNISINPNDTCVYVSDASNGVLVSYKRNLNNGNLTYSETLDRGNTYSFSSIKKVVPNSTGKYIAVLHSMGIDILTHNFNFDTLEYVSEEQLFSPGGVVFSNDSKNFYIQQPGHASLHAYDFSVGTGAISSKRTYENGDSAKLSLDRPVHVELGEDNRFVYVASEYSGNIDILERNDTTGKQTIEKSHSDNTNNLGNFTSFSISPDGEHMYTCAIASDTINIYAIDSLTGEVSLASTHFFGLTGESTKYSISKLKVSPDGKNLYAVSEFNHAVLVYSRNQMTGVINSVQLAVDGSGGFEALNRPREIYCTPDGKNVLIGTVGDHSLVNLARNQSTGELSYVNHLTQSVNIEIGSPQSISGKPDGRFIYLAGNNAIVRIDRDTSTGAISFGKAYRIDDLAISGLDNVILVQVDPKGENLYASFNYSYDIGMLCLFAINQQSGELKLLGSIADDINNDGIDAVSSMAVSNNGNHLYVTSTEDNSLAVYKKLFTVSISGDTIGCISDTITLQVDFTGPDIVWSTGETTQSILVNESGTYSVTVTDEYNKQAMDSIVVTFYSSQLTVIDSALCSSVPMIFNGEILTTSGTYYDSLHTVNGCDSVIQLNFTLLAGSVTNENVSICEGETYNTWSATGEYADTLIAANGCDSIIVTQLTVNPVYEENIVASICEGETYTLGSQTLDQSGNYTEVVQSLSGCDSTVYLNLTVHPVYKESVFASLCEGEIFTFGTQTLTAAGTYTETFTSHLGCDSVVELTLIVEDIDESVTVNRQTLTANQDGATYQWLDCDNSFAEISGETNQSYTTNQNGSYAVEIKHNACIDTSACLSISTLGILENTFNQDIVVYPNPSNGEITINLGETLQSFSVIIIDLNGKQVSQLEFSNTHMFDVNLDVQPGIYLLTIKSDDRKATLRLIKK